MRYGSARRVELAVERRMRTRNTLRYRVAHWPVWVWVYFIVPGPLTAALFAGDASRTTLAWLVLVLLGTATAAAQGLLPGTEPAPYILRFGDALPNPLYRRVNYTVAWSVIVSFATINLVGLIAAVATGRWQMRQTYTAWYLPMVVLIGVLGLLGVLPRARRTTKYEGLDRRYFYGSVWVVTVSQCVLLALWKILPPTRDNDRWKLIAYATALVVMGLLARYGLLPRSRPILTGTVARAD